MTRATQAAQQTLLLLLPAFVLLVGALTVRADWPTSGRVPAGLVLAAAAAPLVAGLALRLTLPQVDLPLVATSGMLTALGAVSMVRLAELPGAAQAFFTSVASRHLAFVVASFAALLLGSNLARFAPLTLRYPYVIALAALGLIGSAMVLGTEVNGARLWVVVGPVRLQPAELARVLLGVFAAAYLYDRRHSLAAPWQLGRLSLPPIPYLVPLAGAVGVALATLVLQNDLGMAALTAVGAYAIVASALATRPTVIAIGVALAAAVWAAAQVSPRVLGRAESWLHPWRDPVGRGYQFVQGEYALAIGGLGGARVAPDVRNVPEVQTDFILAAIGAQSGVLVSAAVLALLAILVLRCARNALLAATELEGRIALALSVLLGLQILLILGGVLRLAPLTGLTVPLVSYGGTSLVVTGFSLGLIVGIGARGGQRTARYG